MNLAIHSHPASVGNSRVAPARGALGRGTGQRHHTSRSRNSRRGQPHLVTAEQPEACCAHTRCDKNSGYACIPLIERDTPVVPFYLQNIEGISVAHDKRLVLSEETIACIENVVPALINFRLRESLHQQPLRPITQSFGIATLPENGSVPATLMKAADDALYRAKAAGRDRVVVTGDAPASDKTPPATALH
jgi:hypothetical protein